MPARRWIRSSASTLTICPCRLSCGIICRVLGASSRFGADDIVLWAELHAFVSTQGRPMRATRKRESFRRDKKRLAFPSEAVSTELRGIPEHIKPIITDADWASTSIPKALGLEDQRAFFDRLLT